MTSIGSARAIAPQHDESNLAGWKVGAAMAGVAGIASFQKSLLPRSSTQQAIVTAASMALAYGVGVGANAIANRVDDSTGLDAVGSRLAVGGAGVAGVLGLTLAMRGKPNLAMDAARTGAGVLAGGAVVGAALIGEQALVDRIQDRTPGGAMAAHAAILGAAALGVGAWVHGMPRMSGVSAEAERAYIAATGGVMGHSAGNVATFDEAGHAALTTLREPMTSVSGRTAGTLLPDGAVGKAGLRFINEATPAVEIARVMGGDAASIKEPIRIYGGMQHAATRAELAEKIFQESLAKGAFDRANVVLYVPSGTGHVNPMPVTASEYLMRGDVASIGMQYGNKPSIQSFQHVDKATDLFDEVLTRFSRHIETLPADARPTLSVYGESLGAWGIQDTFLKSGVPGIAERGIDNVINVGTPRFSKLRAEAIGLGGHRMDASGAMFEFDNLDQLKALAPTQRDGVRAYLLSHYNDPVNKVSPTMLWQRPEWLASTEHATGVPRKMKWLPGVTGIQGLVDNANGATVIPGVLERTGHDYRADMAPVIAEIFRTPTTEAQMKGITGALNQLELSHVHAGAPAIRFPVASAAGAAG